MLISFILMIIRWREYVFAQEKFKLEQVLDNRTVELVKENNTINLVFIYIHFNLKHQKYNKTLKIEYIYAFLFCFMRF